MTDIANWATTASGNNTGTPPNYPTEGMAPSTVNDTMREMMAAIARYVADTNGTLTTGGTGDAYTITTTQNITAYAAGQVILFEADRANTGAATLNVNSIGAKSLRQVDNSTLVAGEVSAGAIYIAVYDGTNFQLLNASKLRLSLDGTAVVTLSDSVAPLVVGPGTGQHIEVDANDIQSKSDATTAASVNINRQGGNTNIGAASGTGQVNIYHDGTLVAQGDAAGLGVRDGAGSQPTLYMRDDTGTSLATMFHIGGGAFYIRSVENSAGLYLQATDSGGATKNLFFSTPGGGGILYHDGNATALMQNDGAEFRRSTGTSTKLDLADSGGTVEGQIDTTLGLRLFSYQDGEPIALYADDSGGTSRSLAIFDPDGPCDLRYQGSPKIVTNSVGVTVNGIAIVGTPTADTHAATKLYVDNVSDQVAGKLDLIEDLDATAVALSSSDRVPFHDSSAGVNRQTNLSDIRGQVYSEHSVNINLNNVDKNSTVCSTATGNITLDLTPIPSSWEAGDYLILTTETSGRIVVDDTGVTMVSRSSQKNVSNLGGTARLIYRGGTDFILSGDLE